MKISLGTLFLLAGVSIGTASAADWIVAPSYYTHDRATGERVAQYAPVGPIYVWGRSDYLESGFQHYRSRIAFGGSVDNYFRVREWGRPVRPFGEWQFPYRPYSVPYPLWDSPYRGMYQFYYGRPPRGGRPGPARPAGP